MDYVIEKEHVSLPVKNSCHALETSFFASPAISFYSVIKNASVQNIVSVDSFQIFVNVFQ
jgi:hypothetical protein